MSAEPLDTNTSRGRILVVDDDREMCRFLAVMLGEEGYAVDAVQDGKAAIDLYAQKPFDLVISDLKMPKMTGTELLGRLREIDAECAVLLLTAFGSIESAVDAMRAGAFHYITKPFHTDEMLIQVERAMERRELRGELKRLRSEVQARDRLQNIIGQSAVMRKIFDTVAQVSDLSANVLISGESGTGKELIARALHFYGSRATGPFVAVNCAAIPEALIESELFGYVRGAFTDARKDRPGLFQEASGGTLFLDEIGEIRLNLQAKLLRVLEDKEVRRLGANQSEKVDTRVVSASNRSLDEMVRQGTFRQDLYYRLNVIRIELPPLRERSDDIALLVDHFIRKFSDGARRKVTGVHADALTALKNYAWPGNIRELEHVVERAVLLGKDATIGIDDLPPDLAASGANATVLDAAMDKQISLRDLEREYIIKVLNKTQGNKSDAARILGVDRTTLYRKLEEYKLKD